MRIVRGALLTGLLLAGLQSPGWGQDTLRVPRLAHPPVIDGALAEWKGLAANDGVWTIERLRHTPWFDATRNRATRHPAEKLGEVDLASVYYVAWDESYLYLGAEARDNANDVTDPEPQDKRWYFKDAICWFVEAPRDTVSEPFGRGDNAFCFVIDQSRPGYAAWWRHGTATAQYVEEPIPAAAVNYRVTMNPWGLSPGDFVLEARVRLADTFGASDPSWKPPKVGDEYGLEIVHTDPDGGDYGGHFIVYGRGDDDATWGHMLLTAGRQQSGTTPDLKALTAADAAGAAVDSTSLPR